MGGWFWIDDEMGEFVGAHSLRTDVLWLTNLPWEYHLSLGVHEFSNIKRADFLPVSLDRLSQELCLDPDEHPALYGESISILASRILDLGIRAYGTTLLDNVFSSNTITQAIARCHSWVDSTTPDDDLHKDIIWSNLTPNATLRHDISRADCAVFRAPFFAHAKSVLSAPTPVAEPWVEVSIPEGDRMAFLSREDLPAVVEVREIALTGTWSGIYDLSSAPLRWARRRRWMTNSEVLFLAEDKAALDIGRIYIQPGGYVCDSLTWNLPQAGDALTLSISAGLLSHAHWLSGAIPLSQSFWPLRSMWIRAADRMRLASILPAFSGIPGLKQIAYGEGAIYMSGPSECITEAMRRAPQVDIAPTQSSWRLGNDRGLVKSQGWLPDQYSPFEKASYRLSNRPIHDILRLDQAAIHSLTDVSAAIRDIGEIYKEIQSA